MQRILRDREVGYFMPSRRPSQACRPDLVSGTPMALPILRFAAVTPSARFHEKESPGPSFMVAIVQHIAPIGEY
jgi:hypothetical protein